MQYVCMCVFEIVEGQSYILQSFMKTPPPFSLFILSARMTCQICLVCLYSTILAPLVVTE